MLVAVSVVDVKVWLVVSCKRRERDQDRVWAEQTEMDLQRPTVVGVSELVVSVRLVDVV